MTRNDLKRKARAIKTGKPAAAVKPAAKATPAPKKAKKAPIQPVPAVEEPREDIVDGATEK